MFASWARPTTLKEPFSCWMLECTSCALASSFKWHRWRTASLHQVHLNRFLSITMKFDAMTQHPDKNQLNEGDDKTSCDVCHLHLLLDKIFFFAFPSSASCHRFHIKCNQLIFASLFVTVDSVVCRWTRLRQQLIVCDALVMQWAAYRRQWRMPLTLLLSNTNNTNCICV